MDSRQVIRRLVLCEGVDVKQARKFMKNAADYAKGELLLSSPETGDEELKEVSWYAAQEKALQFMNLDPTAKPEETNPELITPETLRTFGEGDYLRWLISMANNVYKAFQQFDWIQDHGGSAEHPDQYNKVNEYILSLRDTMTPDGEYFNFIKFLDPGTGNLTNISALVVGLQTHYALSRSSIRSQIPPISSFKSFQDFLKWYVEIGAEVSITMADAVPELNMGEEQLQTLATLGGENVKPIFPGEELLFKAAQTLGREGDVAEIAAVPRYVAARIEYHEAAPPHSLNSSWCTEYGIESEYIDDYLQESPLYVVYGSNEIDRSKYPLKISNDGIPAELPIVRVAQFHYGEYQNTSTFSINDLNNRTLSEQTRIMTFLDVFMYAVQMYEEKKGMDYTPPLPSEAWHDKDAYEQIMRERTRDEEEAQNLRQLAEKFGQEFALFLRNEDETTRYEAAKLFDEFGYGPGDVEVRDERRGAVAWLELKPEYGDASRFPYNPWIRHNMRDNRVKLSPGYVAATISNLLERHKKIAAWNDLIPEFQDALRRLSRVPGQPPSQDIHFFNGRPWYDIPARSDEVRREAARFGVNTERVQDIGMLDAMIALWNFPPEAQQKWAEYFNTHVKSRSEFYRQG